VRILDRELEAAGIPKVDVDGRRIDVHALCHTTATYLAKAGVAPRTAQSIMRHSDIRLTLGTYTDPHLLDQAAALEALPHFTPHPRREPMRATGTTDDRPETLGVLLGGNVLPDVQKRSSMCAESATDRRYPSSTQVAVNSQLSNDVQRHATQRATGLEPATFSLEG